MGFFDTYVDFGSAKYVTRDEKNVLMNNGIPFTIKSVTRDDDNKFGPRYVCSVLLPDPTTGDEEERNMAFSIGKVESRNRMLGQLSEYLKGEGAEPVRVKLELNGQSHIIRPA